MSQHGSSSDEMSSPIPSHHPEVSPPTAERVDLDPARCLPQDGSPLFNALPAEIRNTIFRYALSQYEDATQSFSRDTYYARPDYNAPCRCDTALLRTCQRTYREAWFYPWVSWEHVFFLTSGDRRPGNFEVQTVASMTSSLQAMHAHAGDIEIAAVRIFPQLYQLEDGHALGRILEMPHFHPRLVTITIRHTDWWYWENDVPLRMNSQWVAICAFPDSVRQLRLELESTERRSAQIDAAAEHMASHWRFHRQDGAALAATVKDSKTAARDGDIRHWRGSSILDDCRWLDDEVAPEVLAYYVRTVTFTPVDIPAEGEARERLQGYNLSLMTSTCPTDFDFEGRFPYKDWVERGMEMSEIEDAGIPRGTSAAEIRELLG